jgi:hypothetical protein
MNEAPPLPPRIKDLLEPYPELLDELRMSLHKAVDGSTSSPRFDHAIWALKDALGDMMSIADLEMAEADKRGDVATVESLAIKSSLIGRARSFTVGLSDTRALRIYCDNLDRGAP